MTPSSNLANADSKIGFSRSNFSSAIYARPNLITELSVLSRIYQKVLGKRTTAFLQRLPVMKDEK